MKRTIALAAASTVALGSLVALAPAASAKDGDSKRRGSCSADSDFAVKVKDRKGALRVDFWVKNNAVGQPWTLTVKKGDATALTSTRPTVANDDDGDDDSRHIAEVKWRTTVAPGGTLSFSAAGPNNEICTVTVP